VAPLAPAPPLPVRKLRFEYPDDLALAWNPRMPELACAANSISLLMPFVEPYFVRSVRATLDDLDGPLRDRTEDYVRQELQHHAQHRRFNDLLAVQAPGIRRLESWMRRTYGWLGRTRSRRFNVAFAAGSETIAFGIARWIDRHLRVLFDGADPVASTLFLWHLAEEVEHKTVAYDVYRAAGGGRLRYAWAMSVAAVLLAAGAFAGSVTMLLAERRLFRPTAWFRLIGWSLSFIFVALPVMVISALPGHHPDQLADPAGLEHWLDHLDPETSTVPEWALP
jgi:predicted metal-dependent hydrolase